MNVQSLTEGLSTRTTKRSQLTLNLMRIKSPRLPAVPDFKFVSVLRATPVWSVTVHLYVLFSGVNVSCTIIIFTYVKLPQLAKARTKTLLCNMCFESLKLFLIESGDSLQLMNSRNFA